MMGEGSWEKPNEERVLSSFDGEGISPRLVGPLRGDFATVLPAFLFQECKDP